MKAVLVIDLPVSSLKDIYANVELYGGEIDGTAFHPVCIEGELKPMPKRKGHLNCEGCNHIECEYTEGWNDCIEELEKCG